MSAGKLNMVVFAAVLVAAVLRVSDAQTSHVVGNNTGWTVPTAGPSFYSRWAANQTFAVGDILVFNFPTGVHNVARVNRTAYDSCNAGNTSNLISTGPARVTLSTAGEDFFICTITGHCSAGQRLAVNVTGTANPPASPPPGTPASPSPAPTATPPSSTPTPPSGGAPTPSGSTSPPSPPSAPSPSSPPPAGGVTPPPPSSAASAALSAALPLALFSVAVALLY